jgi:hypothetical protein
MKDGEEVCGHGWEFSQIDGEGEKTYVCGCPDEGGQEVVYSGSAVAEPTRNKVKQTIYPGKALKKRKSFASPAWRPLKTCVSESCVKTSYAADDVDEEACKKTCKVRPGEMCF